ncbi:unnamed protein product [Ectocarpus sp. 4 AP-2014]
MQEEMQLMLDEAVVTRFERAKANLATIASSGSGSGSSSGRGGARVGLMDRRDPFWRQKLFRREGIPYYSSVSLFRAGGGGVGGNKSSGWGNQSGGKRRRQWQGRRGSDDNDDDQDEDSASKGNSNSSSSSKTSGKLYLKVRQPSLRTPSPLLGSSSSLCIPQPPRVTEYSACRGARFGSFVSAPAPSRPATTRLLTSSVLLPISSDLGTYQHMLVC